MKRTTILILMLSLIALPSLAEDDAAWTVKGKAVSGSESIKEDQRSSKFYEYRDLPSGAFLNGLDLTLAKGAWLADFSVERAGRKDGRYSLTLGSPGAYKLSLGYARIPHVFSFEGRSLFFEASPGVFLFPDPIQLAAESAGGNAPYSSRDAVTAASLNGRTVVAGYVDGSLPLPLALQRDRGSLGFSYEITGSLSVNIDAQRETRRGSRPIGAPFGFSNLIELPEPIDTATTNIDASLEFSPKWGTIQAGFFTSSFKNDVPVMRWDNPIRFTDQTFTAPQGAYSPGNGSSVGQFDLSPTNRAHRFYLNAAARILPGIRLLGSVSYGVHSQNEPLLPFTVNTAIHAQFPTSAGTPAASANAKAAVGTADFTLTARLVKNLSLTAGYRSYHFDNNTEELHIEGFTVLDQIWDEIPETIHPYSYSRSKLFGNLSYRLMKNTTLQLGYSRSILARRLGEEDEGESTEGTIKASLDTAPLGWLWLRASYLSGKREWSLEGEKDIYAPGFAFRRYHEADRDRTAWTLTAGLNPFKNFDLSVSYSLARDEYPKSEYGLTDSEVKMTTVDASYTLGSFGALYGFYSRENYDAVQTSRYSGSSTFSTDPANDWTADLKDAFRTMGAGLNVAVVKDKLSLDLSYTRNTSKGTADLSSPPGGTPNTIAPYDQNLDATTLDIIKTKLMWKLSPTLAVAAGYWFERYTIEDITRTKRAVNLYTTVASLYLGALEPNYKYHVGYLKFIFTW